MQKSFRSRRTASKQLHCAGSRHGIISAWSVYGLLICGLCTALVVNYLWLSAVRHDALRCAEAAALAAGSELLSDDLLRSTQTALEQEWRLDRSKLAAVQMSKRYHQISHVPLLRMDDVSYQSTQAEPVQTESQQLSQTVANRIAVPDRVMVSYGGWTANGEPRHKAGMFLPGLTGVREASIGMHATASIQNCVIGFRPSMVSRIPMIPLAIPDSPDGSDKTSWTWLIEQGHGRDDYSWVEDSQSVTRGPDGIPEIELELQLSANVSGLSRLIPIQLNSATDGSVSLCRCIETGIGINDLDAQQGNSLQFPYQSRQVTLQQQDLSPVADSLARLIGQAAVFCLIDGTATMEPESGNYENQARDNETGDIIKLQRPVAARVVYVGQRSKDTVDVVLQPCVLISATAMMAPQNSVARNRYVYQVSLAY